MSHTPTPPPPPNPSDKPKPYELAPESTETAEQPRARLEKPPLMEGFEDDADFTKDPEVEAALKGKPAQARVVAEPTQHVAAHDFVRPGLGNERIWAGIGAALLVATLVATAVNSRFGTLPTVASVLLMLYKVVLHTGTGIVAVWLASWFTEQRFSRVELVAARMFAAVSALAFFFSVRISIFGDHPFERNLWSAVFGAAAYLLLVSGLFRLWGHKLLLVVGTHLGLWLLVQVGLLLSAYVATALPPPGQ